MRRALPALALLLVLGACGIGTLPPDGSAPVLVLADDAAVDGPGISVAEALGHGPTDDLVLVTGALFIDADGTARLCDAIAESFPPQCGGDRIVVEGLVPGDVDGLQTQGGISWAEDVTLFGSVE